jgi:crotonobetainyl-CoA:carnitine CoA-transferase CaiB-like acyl-CoA transferase
MTGPPGRPLRAGASVIDIAGGMFGVIGILAAIERRHRTGRGGHVKCSLFETTAFLVGQHMAQKAVTGTPAAPMPARVSAWAVYDVFETARPDEQLFVGVVSDGQWAAFCEALGLDEFGRDPALALNNDRVLQRDRIIPVLRELFAGMTRDELIDRLGAISLPFAPITRPEDLFEDEHLRAANGLVEVTLEDGTTAMLPALPIEIDGRKAGVRRDLPKAGQHDADVFGGAGAH